LPKSNANPQKLIQMSCWAHWWSVIIQVNLIASRYKMSKDGSQW